MASSMTRPQPIERPDIRPQLRQLLSNRRSPEAMALFEQLSRYVQRRVGMVSRRCGNALQASEQEEVVADVLLGLLKGSLATFRGHTEPELLAFVRTVADRTSWRRIRRKTKERILIHGEAADMVESWNATMPSPDATSEHQASSPLPDADQTYLVNLLEAGSKAELARRAGVSRAAVTQRVQRIRVRIAALSRMERVQQEVWLSQAARRVVAEERP